MVNSVVASQACGGRGVRTAMLQKALFASTALVGVKLSSDGGGVGRRFLRGPAAAAVNLIAAMPTGFTLTAASVALLGGVALASPASAQATKGGNGGTSDGANVQNSTPGGGGGAYGQAGAAGTGQQSGYFDGSGGGGGGVGGAGGAGGAGGSGSYAAGGAGGAAGAAGAAGGNGGDATFVSDTFGPGGGGGGGGGTALTTSGNQTVTTNLTGGAGGAGGASGSGGGGGGGAGGYGIYLTGAATVTVNQGVTVSGGAGGKGGNTGTIYSMGGQGGGGGVGVFGTGTLINAGRILTGAAGVSGSGNGVQGPAAAGFAAVLGGAGGLAVTNTGTITGNAGADAITYTGGANSLTLGANGTQGVLNGTIGITGSLSIDTGTTAGTAATLNNAIHNYTAGAGSLTKIGAGTLILGGANSYTGGTTISDGVLQVTTASLPTGAITDNATLAFVQSGSGSVGSAISGTGVVSVSGLASLGAPITFNGVLTNDGGMTLGTGGYVLLNTNVTASSATGAVRITGNGDTLGIAAGKSVTSTQTAGGDYASAIYGTGQNFTVTNAGTINAPGNRNATFGSNGIYGANGVVVNNTGNIYGIPASTTPANYRSDGVFSFAGTGANIVNNTGGTIVNGALLGNVAGGGVIIGGWDGVFLPGGGTVYNSGDIAGNFYNGIEAATNVTNYAGGRIVGVGAGFGASGVVNNAGIITTGTYDAVNKTITGGSSGTAVAFSGSTLTNSADGMIVGGSYGVYAAGTATITNAGTIGGGTLTGGTFTPGGDSFAVQIGSGTITNSGTLQSGKAALYQSDSAGTLKLTNTNTIGGTTTQQAPQGGNPDDTLIANGVATIFNSGTIASPNFYAVVLNKGGSVVNAANGLIQAGTADADRRGIVSNGDLGVTNYGTINSQTYNLGIQVNNNAKATIVLEAGSTTGSIVAGANTNSLTLYNGFGTANQGLLYNTATGATTVGGTAGANQVVLQNAGTLNAAVVGNVDLGGGTNTLTLAGTGTDAAPGGAAGVQGTLNVATLNNVTNLVKQDVGTWVLTGTVVNNGTSSSNGNFTGGVSVLGGLLAVQTPANSYGADALGRGTITISSGATVRYDNPYSTNNPGIGGAQDYISAGTFTGAGTLAFTGGAGSLTIIDHNGGNAVATVAMDSTGTIAVQSGAVLARGPDVFVGNQANLDIATGASFDGGGVYGGGVGAITVNALNGGGSYVGNGTLTVGVANGTGAFAGIIGNENGGTAALTKTGAGTQTLSGINTYTGATTINGGTLALAGGGKIVNSVVTDNATFDVSGSTGGASVASLSGGGTVYLGAQTLTLNAAAGGSFAGTLMDGGIAGGTGGALTVNATGGTYTLTGTNTYTGTTTISGGTLALGNGGATGSVAGNIVNNGTLQINRSGNPTIANTVTSGSGVVQISANANLTGAITDNRGVNIDAGITAGLGSVTATDGEAVLLGAGATTTIGGTVSSSGGYGVSAGNGGTVNVSQGGIVRGTGAQAIYAPGQVTVDNYGLIQTTATGDSGIIFGGTQVAGQTSTITNEATGRIIGQAQGINATSLTAGTLAVVNKAGGQITGVSNGIGSATTITMTNDGTVSGATGVNVTGVLTLANTGTITGTTTGIANTGALGTATTAATNSGSIVGGTNALRVTGATYLVNTGLIGAGTLSGTPATFTANGNTAVVLAGGTVTNGGTGRVAGALTSSAALTLSNAGTMNAVTVTGAGNSAVTLRSGSTTGQVTLGAGNDAVTIYNGTGAAFAGAPASYVAAGQHNAATVAGLALGAGANTVTLAGSGAEAAAGATVTGQQGTLALDTVSGLSTLTKTGSGNWVLTGAANTSTAGGIAATSAATIYAGNQNTTGASGVLRFSGTSGLTGQIYQNGATVEIDGNGALGAGTVHIVSAAAGQPNLVFVSTGMIGNAVRLETAGGPTLLRAGGGVTGTLTGAITSGAGANIDGQAIAGSQAVTIEGGGTIALSGGNAWSGPTSIIGGSTLRIVAANNIGTGVLAIGDAVTAGTLSTTNTGVITLAGSVALSAGGATVDVADAGGDTTLSGVVSGADLIKTGAGTLSLSGAETYTGATVISAGTLALTGAGSIESSSGVVADGTLDVSGRQAGSASIKTLSGAGAVFLGGNALQLTEASGAFSGVISGAGAAPTDDGLLIAGGRETLTGTNTYTGFTGIGQGATLALAGNGSIAASGGVAVSGTLDIADHVGGVSIRTITDRADAAGAVILGGNTLTLTDGGGADFYGTMTGSGGFTLASNQFTLHGAQDYAGATTIDAGGTLALVDAASVAASSGVAVGGAFDIAAHTGDVTVAGLSGAGGVTLGGNTLILTSGGAFAGVASGAGGLTVTAGDQILTGNNTYVGTTTISGGNLTLGDGGTTGSVAGPIALAAGVLTIDRSDAVALAGAISGGGSLVQVGTGTTTLSGVNTYTGSTTIDAGTLAVSGGTAIADASAVLVNTNGTLQLLSNETIDRVAGAGGIALGANMLTTGGADVSSAFSGVISGGGGLTKVGTGTLTLSGANTFTGTLEIAGGTLAYGANNVLADTATVLVGAGATFDLAGYSDTIGTLDLYGTLSNGGALTAGVYNAYAGSTINQAIGSTGTLNVYGDTALNSRSDAAPVNIYAGTLATGSAQLLSDTGAVAIAAGGTLLLGGDETIGSLGDAAYGQTAGGGAVQLGAHTLTVGGANANGAGSFSGVLTSADGGGFTKDGAGTLILSGANAYNGITTIAGGTLQGTSASISGATIVDNATLAYNQADGGTVGQNISGSGQVTVAGLLAGDALTFAGANTQAGGFVVTDASAVAFTGANTGAGTEVTLQGASTLDNAGGLTGLVGVAGTVAGALILNRGAITGTGGTAVSLAGGTVTNVAGGRIEGALASTAGLVFLNAGSAGAVSDTGAANDVIQLYAGSVTGSVATGAGVDAITLYTGAVDAPAIVDANGVVIRAAGTYAAASFGAIALGSGTNTLTLRGTGTGTAATGATNSIALDATAGAGVINKLDTGTWTLTQGAATTLDAVTAAATITAGSGAPGSGGLLAFDGTTGLFATINVNGGTIRALNSGAFGTGTINMIDPTAQYASGTYANPIVLQATNPANDPSRLQTFGTDAVVTLTGTITELNGPQPLVFESVDAAGAASTGAFVLAGAGNRWTGTTMIGTGTTLRGAATAISGSSIANGGALVFTGGTAAFAAPIGGAGTVTVALDAGNRLTLTGANTYRGTTTINAGSTLQGTTATLSPNSAVVANGRLAFVQNASGAFAPAITGAGTVKVAGAPAATLTFAGANAFTGAVGTLAAFTSSGPGLAFTGATTSVADTVNLTGANARLAVANTGSLTSSGGNTVFASMAGASVTNAGTIRATSANGAAVLLGAGGTVGNAGGATIAANGAAVYALGTLALTNAGSIASANNIGVFQNIAGGVTTTIANQAGGTIVGFRGIDVLNGATVTNAGAITGRTSTGVLLRAGGSVDNAATGAITAGSGGVIFSNAPGTVTNAGRIDGATWGVLQNGGGQAITVTNVAGGTINGTQNNAIYSADANATITNAGTLTGGNAAVYADGALTLNNSGLIRNITGSSNAPAMSGVYSSAANARITNSGTIDSQLQGGHAIKLDGGASTITNLSGGVLAGNGGAAVLLSGAGYTLDLRAGSTVTGGIDARATTGANTVTLAGTLTGGYVGGVGADNVTLLDNASFTGALDGGAGIDTVTLTGIGVGNVNVGDLVRFESVAKTGAGRFNLSGVDASTADFSVQQGILSVSGGTAINDSAIVDVAGAGTLDLAGSEAIGALSGTGSVTLNANTLTIAGPQSTTFAGVISGAGNLVHAGAGTLTLSGANTYTGTTLVSAGTLALGASNVLADATTVLVASGATLDLGANSDTVSRIGIAGTLAGTGTLTAAQYGLQGATVNANLGSGELYQLGGTSTLNGTSGAGRVAVNAGTLVLGGDNRLADNAAVSVVSGAALDLGTHSDTVGGLTLAGTLDGTGTLTAASYTFTGGIANANLGAGTLTQASGNSVLNGTAGATTVAVTGGTLALGASNRFADAASVSVSNGTVLDLGAFNDTVADVALAGTLGGIGTLTANRYQLSGATVNANLGTGTLTQAAGTSALNGTLAAEAVNVAGGTLVLGASNRLADNATVTVASGAALDIAGFTDTVGLFVDNGGTLNGTDTLAASQYQLTNAMVNANLGAGTLFQLGGMSTLNGTAGATSVAVNAGTLALGASNRLADTATVVVASGAILNLGANSDTVGLFVDNGGTLNGTGTLTAAQYQLTGATVNGNLGAGTLFQLGGTSTLNGSSNAVVVNVNAGTLALGAANRLADTATVTMASGATLNLGANSDTVGLFVDNGGTLNGTGTLTAMQYQLTGATVNANLGAGTLFQLGGTSTLSGTSNAGLTMVNAGTLRLGAANRLVDTTTMALAQGATFDLAGYDETVGALSGAGALALGADTLTVGGTNGDFTFAGASSGAGGITKTGTGTFTLVGNQGLTGRLSVNAGTLLLAGNTAGSARVQDGTLTGAGAIAGNLALASGTLSPSVAGQPVATFQAGSLTVTGGAYAVDFGGASNGFASDLIRVAGAATLSGGTVAPRAIDPTNGYRVSQTYTVVQAGSLSGQFANGSGFAAVGNNADLQYRLRYDLAPNSVLLEVRKQIDFTAGLGGTGNQQAIAAAFNGSAFTASDSFATTLNQIAALDAAGRRAAFDSIGGEALASVSSSVALAGARFSDIVRARLSRGGDAANGTADLTGLFGANRSAALRVAAPTAGGLGLTGTNGGERVAAWVQGFGADGRIEGATGQRTLDNDTAGVALGLEGRFGGLTLGLAGTITDIDARVRSLASRNSGTLYQGGGYAAYDDGKSFLHASGSYFGGTIDTARSVRIGTAFIGRARGEADTDGYTLGAAIGHRFGGETGYRFTPQLGGQLVEVTRDAFTETGAGGLSLQAGREKRTLYTATAEGRLSHRAAAPGGVVEPYVSGGVQVNFGDRDTLAALRLTGAPTGAGAFAIEGARIGKVVGLLGGGIDAHPTDRVTLGAGVETTLSDRQKEARATLRLRIGF